MKLTHIRILHQEKPMGIDRIPYVSWMLESEQENTVQTAYEIQVTGEAGQTLYKSGHVEGRDTAYIVLGDKMPRSREICNVRICVWDNHGNSANGETSFEMGLLAETDWKAKWVMPVKRRKKGKPGFGNQKPATMFRKKFVLQEKPVKARLYATCHGVYEVSVNGKKPDERIFAPEHTVYRDYLCYQTYDVTEFLVKGENALGMYVGDGWYLGPQSLPNMKHMIYNHAVLFQLEVLYNDGSSETVISDSSVKTALGPVRSSDLFAGELYDAGRECDGWNMPGYSDDAWEGTKEEKFGYSNLRAQNDAPVMPVMKIPVKQILHSPKGETILDFDQVVAGFVQMKIREKEGVKITLDHCEVLDREGNYFNNIMGAGGVGKGCDQRDEYISNGRECTWQPRFTYHGFRYVRITGIENPQPKDFCAVVLTTWKEETGVFQTSDERLNRLYENIRWSQRTNMLSIPTDCPQREKAGWTGDMLVYAKTALQNEDCTPLFTRWLSNMACDQDEYGIVPMVVPNDGNYPKTGKLMNMMYKEKGQATSSGWGDAAVAVPFAMYQVTGNTDILRQQFFCMKKWCDYIIGQAEKKRKKGSKRPEEIERYLWDTGYHYGEWLIPSQNKNGLDMVNLKKIMEESACYTAPIFGWNSVSVFATICRILGEKEYGDKYQEIADKMKYAIQAGVIGEDGSMPSDLMGAYVLPIAFDLVPEKWKAKFAENLIRKVKENGNCMDTGFLATPFLLDALCIIGREDMAKELLWQEKVPSWFSEVNAGATTIWENCFGYNEHGDPGILSFNHYSFGCVADWIFRYIGGIDTDTAGYRHLVIAPHPDENLQWARRAFLTINGLAVCEWHRTKKDGEEKICVEVTVPCNCTATIYLPDGRKIEKGSGRYIF